MTLFAPSFILGHSPRNGSANSLLTVHPMSIRSAIGVICHELRFRECISVIEYRHDEHKKLICGIPRAARQIDLPDVVSRFGTFPFQDVVNSAFVCVKYAGREYLRTRRVDALLAWAAEKRLPFIHLHDNTYATLGNLSPKHEASVFRRFLADNSVHSWPEKWSIDEQSWDKVRPGLFAHGWTLGGMNWSLGPNGAEFNLWGGTLRASLVEPLQRLSEVGMQLSIRFAVTGDCKVKLTRATCPLDDFNAQPLRR